jgi:hypothetical protein
MKYLLFVFGICFFLTSCKDETGNNTAASTFELDFNFRPMADGKDVSLGKYYLLRGTDSFMVERLDFYVDKLALNSSFKTDSVFLFSLGSGLGNVSKTFGFKSNQIPSKIDNIDFRLGLDSMVNHGDPNKYHVTHSLSSYKNMSWTWASGYRYIVFEGKIKTSTALLSYSFHTGLAYKNNAKLSLNKTLSSSSKNEINLALNLEKIFYPTSGANVFYKNGELQAHADAADAELTDKVAKNFAAAFSIQ